MEFYIWDVFGETFWQQTITTHTHPYTRLTHLETNKTLAIAITALTATILDIHFKSNL
jgi:hypothetical protein